MLNVQFTHGVGRACREATTGPFAEVMITAYTIAVREGDAWRRLAERRDDGLWMFHAPAPGLFRQALVRAA